MQKALQGAGLVGKRSKRERHRRRRPRRPLPGMLLHIDGSKHCWFQNSQRYDLIVILDDATSEIYYAQLVEEESTRTVMAGLREVIESKGLFCALYSDRGSHFFVTPKAGEPVATATGQTKSEVERTLDAILDRASNALAGGDRVELRGFGILEAKETKARTGRNPGTGETIQIAASRRATFRPSKELKERLNGKREAAQESNA